MLQILKQKIEELEAKEQREITTDERFNLEMQIYREHRERKEEIEKLWNIDHNFKFEHIHVYKPLPNFDQKLRVFNRNGEHFDFIAEVSTDSRMKRSISYVKCCKSKYYAGNRSLGHLWNHLINKHNIFHISRFDVKAAIDLYSNCSTEYERYGY